MTESEKKAIALALELALRYANQGRVLSGEALGVVANALETVKPGALAYLDSRE